MKYKNENTFLTDVNRILVIQFRPIGDVLLSTPLIKLLRDAYPEAHIAFLVERIPGQVLEDNPHLDEIIYYEHKKSDIIGSYKFFRSLKKQHFDLVIDLLGTPGTAWATFFSRAKYRVGYTVRIRKYVYNIRVSNIVEERYSALKKLVLLKSIGINAEESTLYFPLRNEHYEFAEKFFSEHGIPEKNFTVCLSPTSGRQAVRWRKEGYAALNDLLVEKYRAKIIMLWGGDGEKEYVQEILNLTAFPPVLIPNTSVNQMAAVIKRCSLFIGNDSGVRHVAVAMGVPTIGIFGPTNDITWTPPDRTRNIVVKGKISCLACDLTECDHHSCMKSVEPKDIEQAMFQIEEINRFL